MCRLSRHALNGVLIVACAILQCFGPSADAHRLDEYLQATLFTLEQDRIDMLMRLTPGVDVSAFVLAGIDRDGNSVVSETERHAYAERVLRDLSIAVDGKTLRLELSSVEFPATEDFREGLGEIQIRYSAALPRGGANRRLVFENHHQARISAYLVNCLVPRDRGIRIVAQERNTQQSFYQLDFTQGARPPSPTLPRATGEGAVRRLN